MVNFPPQTSADQWDTRPVPGPSYLMFCDVYAFQLQKSSDFQMDTQLKSDRKVNPSWILCVCSTNDISELNKTPEERYLSRYVCALEVRWVCLEGSRDVGGRFRVHQGSMGLEVSLVGPGDLGVKDIWERGLGVKQLFAGLFVYYWFIFQTDI